MSLDLLPLIACDEVELDEANELLEQWAHPLGACHRPFETRCHLLAVDRGPVALTVTASPVSPTVDAEPRPGIVELARIARPPDHPWVLRPMLRLWREVLAHQWRSWPVETAIAYALPGSPGNLYRWDGWERVGECKPWAGGGQWQKTKAANDIADGVKTLWRWRYASGERMPRTRLKDRSPTRAGTMRYVDTSLLRWAPLDGDGR